MSRTASKTSKTARRAIYIIAVIVFQEVVLRICFPLGELSNFDRSTYSFLGQDDIGQFRHQNFHWESGLDTAHRYLMNYNTYGFRGEEWTIAAPENKKRILFIGDSFVAGVMSEEDETLPAQFAKKMAGEEVEVLNGGIAGAGMSEYMQLLVDMAPVFKPDVVVVCIYANDLGDYRPLNPLLDWKPRYHSPYKPRLLELTKQINNDNPVPFRWNSSVAMYEPVPSPNNPWTDKEAELQQHVSFEVGEAMKNGTFHPYKMNGVLLEKMFLEMPPHLDDVIGPLKIYCLNSGAELVVAYIPSKNQMSTHYYSYEKEQCQLECPDQLDLTLPKYQLHQQKLVEECKRQGVPFVDFSTTIREKEDNGVHLYWNYDEHMRSKGNALLAEELYNQWLWPHE